MAISGLLDTATEVSGYKELLAALRRHIASTASKSRLSSAVVLAPAKPYVLAALQQDLNAAMLVIVRDERHARHLHDQVRMWSLDEDSVLLFPEPDYLPYEQQGADRTSAAERANVLVSMIREKPLVICSARGLIHMTTPAAVFREAISTYRVGERLDVAAAMAALNRLGYERQTSVDSPGTFSQRGGILDIFAPGAEQPVRIELYGDEVESVRAFDPLTQRSEQKLRSFTIVPPADLLASFGPSGYEHASALSMASMSEAARVRWHEQLEKLKAGQWFEGLDLFAGFLHEQPSSIAYYLQTGGLVVIDQPDMVETAVGELDTQTLELYARQQERGELPAGIRQPYHNWESINAQLGGLPGLQLAAWDSESAEDQKKARKLMRTFLLEFTPQPKYGGQLQRVEADCRESMARGEAIVVATLQVERLAELWGDHLPLETVTADLPETLHSDRIYLVHAGLSEGFGARARDQRELFRLLTDLELFGYAKPRRETRFARARRVRSISDLVPGDLVVHVDHGIGEYQGLIVMTLDGNEREYLKLRYAEGDQLYVPVDQIDRVAPYVGGGAEERPALHRLGSGDWERARARVKRAVRDIAQELLSLYASRHLVEGHAFSADNTWQEEFEAAFPYVETTDQLEAIRLVKEDMEKATPMDRLVCGDVGYGKTEVALRAAFKAVADGRQVAILVPTTILAQQHFNTFKARLQTFPVKLELLSRFRSEREQVQAVQGLRDGTVDIVVGTHRLLQKDILFKNLGLVIVDEEQRFGVADKERLKQMRREVDVLTLTATPIPRTLYMSLVGVRDMCVIDTPPDERLPIRTNVQPYSDDMVREAILRELDRGGQVYFVHNRVQDIGRVANQVQELVPQARVGIGHGQMEEGELERVMLQFIAGETDVLVCTTIIESGLDIPNANTLIVNRADRMGLAQLYQLRGRVGRGATRAHAYFLYPKGTQISEVAEKRLRAIFEATQLGAGFHIAMKDLEIRGAGNLLGAEQHGHVAAVGFDLYSHMLEEAVQELRASRQAAPVPRIAPSAASIDLPLDAHIPNSYVSDADTRMELYRRLGALQSPAEVDEFRAELRDRFGPVPDHTVNLLLLVRMRLLAQEAGVKSVSGLDGQVVLKLPSTTHLNRLALLKFAPGALSIGPTQIRLERARLGSDWVGAVERFLQEIAHMRTDALKAAAGLA